MPRRRTTVDTGLVETPPTSATAPSPVPFAEPSPLGLLCLAIGCAALVPVAFGTAVTPDALRTAAMFCLLFGAGGQFLAGMMSFANKNLLGGTLFTTFAFNWVYNWWSLSGAAEGKFANGEVGFAVDVCFIIIFVVLTYAFGYFSKLLFLFLLDIDFLYAFRILNHTLHTRAYSTPIALCTVFLVAIALYLAFGILVNSSAGRVVFPMPGPMFKAGPGAPPAH
jgi:succinate-acetate transporter protein